MEKVWIGGEGEECAFWASCAALKKGGRGLGGGGGGGGGGI